MKGFWDARNRRASKTKVIKQESTHFYWDSWLPKHRKKKITWNLNCFPLKLSLLWANRTPIFLLRTNSLNYTQRINLVLDDSFNEWSLPIPFFPFISVDVLKNGINLNFSRVFPIQGAQTERFERVYWVVHFNSGLFQSCSGAKVKKNVKNVLWILMTLRILIFVMFEFVWIVE